MPFVFWRQSVLSCQVCGRCVFLCVLSEGCVCVPWMCVSISRLLVSFVSFNCICVFLGFCVSCVSFFSEYVDRGCACPCVSLCACLLMCCVRLVCPCDCPRCLLVSVGASSRLCLDGYPRPPSLLLCPARRHLPCSQRYKRGSRSRQVRAHGICLQWQLKTVLPVVSE